jgi:hypothetical protein
MGLLVAPVSAITTPSRWSSPPDLGRELVAVVPALGTLVRARNDCFIALDLDPRDFRLPLFAALLTALE